jgi:predicted transcriptional regulator
MVENQRLRRLTMSHRFEEVLTVKVPKGTREALQRLAEKRYLTIGSVIRVAIMRELEEAGREEERRAKVA